MKKLLVLVSCGIFSSAVLCAQSQNNGEYPLIISAIARKTIDKANGKYVTSYVIACSFERELSSNQRSYLEKPANWTTWTIAGRFRQYSIQETSFPADNLCLLIGNWDISDEITLSLNGQKPLVVKRDDAQKWRYGLGKLFNLNLQRLAEQDALYAFDYDLKINALERNISSAGRGIWIRSFSLSICSKGTFASDDTVRNGTQSSIGLSIDPFYFVGGLVYRSAIELSYQIETRMNEAENKIFDVINANLSVGAEIEVPFTNYPVYKLHQRTRYVRVAMPLTLGINFLARGKTIDGVRSQPRLDFKAIYELALSPYLIVKGEWHKSRFYGLSSELEHAATYFSVSFAQDIDAVIKLLGIGDRIKDIGEFRGKHFVFLKWSKGRKAPAFVDLDEVTMGFGTYF